MMRPRAEAYCARRRVQSLMANEGRDGCGRAAGDLAALYQPLLRNFPLPVMLAV